MATIKAGTYKLSKTPNLINNSKAGTTEDIATDNTVFIKDTVIYNGTEIECNGKGIQITWAGVKSSGVSAKGSIEIVNATPNDYMWRISEASDGSSYQYRFANLTAPTDEQFDKVLTITLLSDVTVSQDLYDWWTANTTSQTAKLSVDLTTLPGWANLAAGNHTIKIKAKGTGYKDSELSAGVTVSKAASTVTLEAGTYKFVESPQFNIVESDDNISVDLSGKMNTLVAENIYGEMSPFNNITIYFSPVSSRNYVTISCSDENDTNYINYQSSEWSYTNKNEEFTATDTTKLRTVIFETDQQVSQEFYTWFTANANKVYTLEAGTYKWIDEPIRAMNIPVEYFSFTSRDEPYYGVDIQSTGYILYKTADVDDVVAYDFDTKEWNSNPAYQTITLSTSQTVSAEFYNWAITQGNLVKYEETYLLNTTLSMPSTATYYDLEGGYKIGDSIYDSICIGYNNGKELRIAWSDDSGDLMWNTLYNSSGWLKQSNRGLTLLKEPAPAFLTWLQANSTQPV